MKIDNIRTELTGHVYRGSAHESSDGCGTCDGAMCETCNTEYITTDGCHFDDPAEAREWAALLLEDWNTLVPNMPEKADSGTFIIRDDKMFVHCTTLEPVEGTDRCQSVDHFIPANPEAPGYQEKYDEAMEAKMLYDKCTKCDKDQVYFSNDCSIVGCIGVFYQCRRDGSKYKRG